MAIKKTELYSSLSKGDKEVGEKLNIVLEGIGKENELPWLANKDNNFLVLHCNMLDFDLV